jgi:hypothetical protein
MAMDSYLTRKLLLASAFAYFSAILILVINQYWVNYSASDGIVLANGENVGGDFPIFYVAGKLYNNSRSELYNYSLQLEELRSIFRGTSQSEHSLVFIYPPPVALMFSAFSSLSLLEAFLAWAFLSLLVFALASLIVIRRSQLTFFQGFLVILYGLSFIPFIFDCLGAGQLAVIGFLIFSLVFYARTIKNEWLEGIVLGFGFYKPPLFLFFGLLALYERRWRCVIGATATLSVLIFLSLVCLGYSDLQNYFVLASNYRYGNELTSNLSLPPFRGVGLYALLTQWIGSKFIINGLFISLLFLTLEVMRRTKRRLSSDNSTLQSLAFSAEVSLSVLFSIQCISYDLTMLLPVLYIVSAQLLRRTITVSKGLLFSCLVLFQVEWLLRTTYEDVEYSPITPFLLIILVISLIFVAKSEHKNLNPA